jgi:hypothetical protein
LELFSEVFKNVRGFPRGTLLIIRDAPEAAGQALAGLDKQAPNAPGIEAQQLSRITMAVKGAVRRLDPDFYSDSVERMDDLNPAESLEEWASSLSHLRSETFQNVRRAQEQLNTLRRDVARWQEYIKTLSAQVLCEKTKFANWVRDANNCSQDLIDAVALLNSLDTSKLEARLKTFNTLRRQRIISAAQEIYNDLDEVTKEAVKWNLMGNNKIKLW